MLSRAVNRFLGRRRLEHSALVVVGALTCGALGALSNVRSLYAAAGAVAVAGTGLAVADPVLVGVLALPATMLLQRIGGGVGSSLDTSDIFIVIATLLALPLIRWETSPSLRKMLALVGVYQGLLIFAVVAHPNIHNALEWLHRLFLVGGSLVVGWAVASSGRVAQTMRLFVGAAIILAALTIEHSILLHFKPAQWGLYQKNYVGGVMWMAIALTHFRPTWAGIGARLARLKYLFLIALLATQSKQAIIALVVAILAGAVRHRGIRRRSKTLAVLLLPLAVFTYVAASAELSKANQHLNSAGVRLVSYSADLHVWQLNIWFGQGMRWFYLPQFAGYIQPTNILMESLTDAGIIGTIGLLVLIVGSLRLLAIQPRDFATLAFVLVLGRAVTGMLDSYWISAVGAIPWLVSGMALGLTDNQYRLGRSNPRARLWTYVGGSGNTIIDAGGPSL